MRAVLIAICAAALLACSPGTDTHSHGTEHAQHDGVQISQAWLRPPAPGRDIAAGYAEFHNNGPANRLVSVTSPVSDRIELHTHLHDNGVMKMRRVEGVDLPAGQSVSFKPGGYHLMLFGARLSEADMGNKVAVTFHFEDGSETLVHAKVGQMADKSHDGHH